MTKLLHQIFYGNKKFDFTKETIHALAEPYMLTVARWESCVTDAKERVATKPPALLPPTMATSCAEKPPYVAPSAPAAIIPQSANTLFWSIFIGQYGYDEYLRIGTKYLNREMDEKQRIVASLASQPKKMKLSNYKITNVAIQEILAEMSILQHDTFMTLVAYASFYEKTILLVFDHSYLLFGRNGEDVDLDPSHTIVVVQQPECGRRKRIYGVLYPTTREQIDDVLQSKIRLDHYAKPMKGMSAYKLADLESIVHKIPSLETATKRTKSDLYNAIVHYLAIPYQK